MENDQPIQDSLGSHYAWLFNSLHARHLSVPDPPLTKERIGDPKQRTIFLFVTPPTNQNIANIPNIRLRHVNARTHHDPSESVQCMHT